MLFRYYCNKHGIKYIVRFCFTSSTKSNIRLYLRRRVIHKKLNKQFRSNKIKQGIYLLTPIIPPPNSLTTKFTIHSYTKIKIFLTGSDYGDYAWSIDLGFNTAYYQEFQTQEPVNNQINLRESKIRWNSTACHGGL